MPDLIQIVARLTRLTDRDDLEATLARALMDIAPADRLVLWRLEGGMPRSGLALPPGVAPRPLAPAWMMEAAQTDQIRARRDSTGWHYVLPIGGLAQDAASIVLSAKIPLSEACLRVLADLLRIYGNHVAVLDHSARDHLTGLFNRRTFDAGFGRMRRMDRRGPCRTHLAVADIDFFKRVNDRFGHPYGDEVLVIVARLMNDCFRDGDLCYRFGGEEFVLLLRQADRAGAEAALDRFRQAVGGFAFPQVGRVTISIGFTDIDPADNGAAAFGRADQALYIAKSSGRDQVLCYERLVAAGGIRPVKAAVRELELF